MAEKKCGIYLHTEDGIRISTVLVHGDGAERRRPAVTPTEALLDAVSIDYADYRREIRRLREAHSLLEPKLDIAMSELEDLASEALLLPSMIAERDSVGAFFLDCLLDRCLRMTDDGSASFLLSAGQTLLRVLEAPILAQIRLKNIFEMAFDATELTTPQEQMTRLHSVYPDIAQMCAPDELDQPPLILQASSVYGLRMLELMLYFRQDSQRIARCEHCWEYFIPKTKKVTRYCDRVLEGQSCKQRGANLARHKKQEQNDVLLLYRQLRERMYARMQRYEEASPNQRQRLIQFDSIRYGDWSELASRVRLEYANGTISAEAFLRQIDTMGDLKSYDVKECEFLPEDSVWQKLVARNIDFDPEKFFPPSMMSLDLGAENLQWEIHTAEELQAQAQEGHTSLRAKYGRGKKERD